MRTGQRRPAYLVVEVVEPIGYSCVMTQTIEKRVEDLEKQVAALGQQVLELRPPTKDWRRTAGCLPDDEMTREAARFRGKPGRRRPVPGRRPPSNRPGKQRFSEGRLTQRRQEAKAQGTVRWRGKDSSKSLTRQVMVPNSRITCVFAPLRLCSQPIRLPVQPVEVRRW